MDPSHLAFMARSDPAVVLDMEHSPRPGEVTGGLRRGSAQSLRTERRAHDAQALVIYALVLLGVWRLVHKRSIEPLVDHWQHSSWMTAYAADMQGVGYMRRDSIRPPTLERASSSAERETAALAGADPPRAALDGEALFRSAEHDAEVDELLNACEDPAEW